jgi:CubicO group peptidase (beta-lactamase class C family)
LAEPGEVFGYSETGIVIAGYVLQRITGRPFPALIREVLAVPAGMAATTAGRPTGVTGPDPNPATLPALGLYSSAADLARLGIVHLRGGAAGDSLHTPYTDVGLDIARAYGLGIALGPRFGGALSAGHEGHHRDHWAKLQVIPQRDIGLAWLDTCGADPARQAYRHHHVERLLRLLGAGPRSWRRDDEGRPADVDPDRVAGRYGRLTGRAVEVRPYPGGLRATDGLSTVDYRHLGGRVHACPGATVPARIPWAPDPDSTRSALYVVGPAAAPTHLLLNGLPYRRLPR